MFARNWKSPVYKLCVLNGVNAADRILELMFKGWRWMDWPLSFFMVQSQWNLRRGIWNSVDYSTINNEDKNPPVIIYCTSSIRVESVKSKRRGRTGQSNCRRSENLTNKTSFSRAATMLPGPSKIPRQCWPKCREFSKIFLNLKLRLTHLYLSLHTS